MTENYKCRNGHIFTKVGSIAECPKCSTHLCNPIKEVRAPITTLPSSHKVNRISKTYITSFSSFFWISFTLSLLGWIFWVPTMSTPWYHNGFSSGKRSEARCRNSDMSVERCDIDYSDPSSAVAWPLPSISFPVVLKK